MSDEKDPDTCDEIAAAVKKTEPEEKGRQAYLIKRAIDLGCVDQIPDEWTVEVNE